MAAYQDNVPKVTVHPPSASHDLSHGNVDSRVDETSKSTKGISDSDGEELLPTTPNHREDSNTRNVRTKRRKHPRMLPPVVARPLPPLGSYKDSSC